MIVRHKLRLGERSVWYCDRCKTNYMGWTRYFDKGHLAFRVLGTQWRAM